MSFFYFGNSIVFVYLAPLIRTKTDNKEKTFPTLADLLQENSVFPEYSIKLRNKPECSMSTSFEYQVSEPNI